MLKKLCALIMAFAMVASLLAVGVGATEAVRVTGDVTTTVSGGVVKAEVQVYNPAAAKHEAALLVAVYEKATDKLYDIGSYRTNIEAGSYMVLRAEADMPNETDYEKRTFVWDGMSSILPIAEDDGIAPAAPTALAATNDLTSVSLTWTAPADNDVVFYNIYRGTSKIATATRCEYVDADLDINGTYSYQVSAVDGMGNESAKTAAVSATTSVTADAVILMEDIDTSANYSGNYYGKLKETTTGTSNIDFWGSLSGNMSVITSASEISDDVAAQYGVISYSDVEGTAKSCLYIENCTTANTVLMRCVVSQDVFSSADDTEGTFIVTYLDNSTEPIYFRYYTTALNSSTPPQGKDSGKKVLVNRTGTGKWKTAHMSFSDLGFNNDTYKRTMHFYTAATEVPSDAPYFIHKIELVKGIVTGTESVSMEVDTNGNKTGDIDTMYAEIDTAPDGSQAFWIQRDAGNQEKLRIGVPADYMTYGVDKNAVIRVTYYDAMPVSKDGMRVMLDYVGYDTETTGKNTETNHTTTDMWVPLTGTNTWKTFELEVSDAGFNSTYNGYGNGIDIRLDSYMQGGVSNSTTEKLWIKKVEVIKLP